VQRLTIHVWVSLVEFLVEVIEKTGEFGVRFHLGAETDQLVLTVHLFIKEGLEETVGCMVLGLQTRFRQFVEMLSVGLLGVEQGLESCNRTLPARWWSFLYIYIY